MIPSPPSMWTCTFVVSHATHASNDTIVPCTNSAVALVSLWWFWWLLRWWKLPHVCRKNRSVNILSQMHTTTNSTILTWAHPHSVNRCSRCPNYQRHCRDIDWPQSAHPHRSNCPMHNPKYRGSTHCICPHQYHLHISRKTRTNIIIILLSITFNHPTNKHLLYTHRMDRWMVEPQHFHTDHKHCAATNYCRSHCCARLLVCWCRWHDAPGPSEWFRWSRPFWICPYCCVFCCAAIADCVQSKSSWKYSFSDRIWALVAGIACHWSTGTCIVWMAHVDLAECAANSSRSHRHASMYNRRPHSNRLWFCSRFRCVVGRAKPSLVRRYAVAGYVFSGRRLWPLFWWWLCHRSTKPWWTVMEHCECGEFSEKIKERMRLWTNNYTVITTNFIC